MKIRFLIATFMMFSILFSNNIFAGHVDSCFASDRECMEHLVEHANSESKKGVAIVVAAGLVWLLSKDREVDSDEKYVRYNELMNGKGIRVNSFKSNYRLAVFPNQSKSALNNGSLNLHATRDYLNSSEQKLLVFEYDF
jgi:hypothetical protein